MELIDLYQVIDQFDDHVFLACRDTLFGVLDFKILSQDEIRRVDLKEKLAVFFSYNETCKKAEGHFDKPLASFVNRAIAEHFVFIREKRAAKYYALLRASFSSINNGSADISTIENLILIYISNFAEYARNPEGVKREEKVKIANVNYYLSRDAVDVANYILKNLTICKRTTKRKVLKKETIVTRFSDDEKLFAYIITVLFIYRILQFEGEL